MLSPCWCPLGDNVSRVIIFGFRVVMRKKGSGTFHCPNERVDRTYLLTKAQRFFTLFFIPLIPLNVVGEIVECEGCHTKFNPNVLTIPTSTQLGERLANAMRTLIVALLRTSEPATTARRAAAVGVLTRYLPDANDSWLDADLAAIDPRLLDEQMQLVGPLLESAGQEALVTNGAWVALADGPIDDASRAVLERAGIGLGMTVVHVRGAITAAIESVHRGS